MLFRSEAASDEIDTVVAQAKQLMREASRITLGGFELESDAKIFRYPDRYMDKRGTVMWETVKRLLDEIER